MIFSSLLTLCIVCATCTTKNFLVAAGDYATLRAVRTNDASQVSTYWNAYQVSVDEEKHPRLLRLSGRQADIVAYAPLCNGAGGDAQLPPNRFREFTFNDETLLDPTRTGIYNFEVQYNCSNRNDGTPLHADGEIGIRSRDSPLWKVWTYATFAADEVRLGRHHPRNVEARKEWRSKAGTVFGCARSSTENVCEFEAHAKAPGTNTHSRRTFIVDFQVDDSHIYLPHSLYLDFTGLHWANGVKVRKVEDWPSLILQDAHNKDTRIELDARLFIPRAFELSFSKPKKESEWPHFVSQLLTDSGVLVARRDDDDRVLLGTRILERYTLHKDYLGARMLASHTPVVDHFHFAELLLFIFIFTSYISHKATVMEPLSFFLLGTWPRCHICGSVYITACKRHSGVFLGLYMHYVVQVLVLTAAWFALAYDARLNNTSGSLLEVTVWAYTALGIATLVYVVSTVFEFYCTPRWGLRDIRRMVIVQASAFETACGVGLFAVASVVRGGDDLITVLLAFIALLVVYDSLRRAFVVFYAFLPRYDLQFAKPQPSGASSFFFYLYAILVVIGHGSIYTTYVMTRYILAPTLQNSAVFTTLAVVSAFVLAFSVTSAYITRAMRENVRRGLQRIKQAST